MSKHSMQGKCSTTGFQRSLTCFSRQDGPGTFSETRVPCCSAGPCSQPWPGVLPQQGLGAVHPPAADSALPGRRAKAQGSW